VDDLHMIRAFQSLFIQKAGRRCGASSIERKEL
jgi:hypothetical protein